MKSKLLILFLFTPLICFSQSDSLRIHLLEQRQQQFDLKLDRFLSVHNGGVALIGVAALATVVNSQASGDKSVYIISGMIGLIGVGCVSFAPNYLRIK